MAFKFRVHCVELERGWGQDFYHCDFDTRAEAEKYMFDTNAKNTAKVVPDWYCRADKIEIVEVPDAETPPWEPIPEDENVRTEASYVDFYE